jgi:hypothetical protein
MPTSTKCQKIKKKMTVDVTQDDDRLWYLRLFYNGAFSIASKNDLDNQNLLLATVQLLDKNLWCFFYFEQKNQSNSVFFCQMRTTRPSEAPPLDHSKASDVIAEIEREINRKKPDCDLSTS